MKLHLPVSLFRTLLSCLALVGSPVVMTLLPTSMAARLPQYDNYEPVVLRGGAVRHDSGDMDLSNEGMLSYSGNSVKLGNVIQTHASVYVTTYTDCRGGAIFNAGTLMLRDHSSLSLTGNEADGRGGAISNEGGLTLSNNGSILFKSNETSINGGAISNERGAVSELLQNGDVTFSSNSASYYSPLPATEINPEGGCGGAIENSGSFTLSENGNVCFSYNTASSGYSSGGGAIYNAGDFTLSSNESVTFNGNTADYCAAVYNASTFRLNGNGAVIFNGNSAQGMGAIGNWGNFSLSGNEFVSFSGNSSAASSTFSGGGAIYTHYTFSLIGNGVVNFIGNSSRSRGGAIENIRDLTIADNGDVTFSGNTASSDIAVGGAIYNSDTFTLRGNGNVLFEKNTEVREGVYRLRSIYAEPNGSYGLSTMLLNMSASSGKSITFRDSIYAMGIVNLNQDGAGDIIFTGVSTEADLREVKGGVDGTAEEILNSRTSEFGWRATLYGGRLIVEDEAILKVDSLSVAEGASIVVKDGTLALNNGNATMTTAAGAEKGVIAGASLGESSLAGADAEHRGVVDGAHIDLAEGADFSMQHLVLSATTRITDAPATLQLDDVTAELVMGVNASLTGSDMLMAGTTLTEGGRTLTLAENAGVVMLEATNFDSVTLCGTTLVLELAGMTLEMLDGAEYIAVSFTGGTGYAGFSSALSVTLTADGVNFAEGYSLSSDGATSSTRYFHAEKVSVTPEPATATLSMLALAALAARRKRK